MFPIQFVTGGTIIFSNLSLLMRFVCYFLGSVLESCRYTSFVMPHCLGASCVMQIRKSRLYLFERASRCFHDLYPNLKKHRLYRQAFSPICSPQALSILL